jgi:hypothetical protein
VYTVNTEFVVRIMKNITLSAEENLIEAARLRARAEHSTLNAQFRAWLTAYVWPQRHIATAVEVISDIRQTAKTGGRKFTRDEMNER